jgi:hypothetical protein
MGIGTLLREHAEELVQRALLQLDDLTQFTASSQTPSHEEESDHE